jgi:hypothetical protein
LVTGIAALCLPSKGPKGKTRYAFSTREFLRFSTRALEPTIAAGEHNCRMN